MILNSAPQDQAVLSNVGQIGEFRIRNSAKAFNILSSGLYANKIRAIIRELSCNAIDSHVAAGNVNTPFDVHLPNALEPHFSIRDYGVGLNHDQVTNIYTTYFESTKTESNEFIGALGLGSKSPFSYTDNFTVTAVKDGRKGIYTAFINEQGVPSIALMMEEQTTDPNGVEVKFSVNEKYDYSKFRDEARNVYRWFNQKPVVSGSDNFDIPKLEFESENIIPGVHSIKDSRVTYAVMGNISYPIEIPQSDKSLGDLCKLLSCGLVMEFNIGELDFQASREGLSYVPQTIASIKSKLENVNEALSKVISKEANSITNVWQKALFLSEKANLSLWNSAVYKYITDTKFEYVNIQSSWPRLHKFLLDEKVLKEQYNIVIRGFHKSLNYNACSTEKVHHTYEKVNGVDMPKTVWQFTISKEVRFVVNDTKIGCLDRAKYHVKNSTYLKDNNLNGVHMYVIEAFDKSKPVLVDSFKKLIANPPENYFMQASSLLQKDRAKSMGKNVTIMVLEERGGYHRRHDANELVWRDAGKVDSFDKNITFYYIPLSGFVALNRCSDVKTLGKNLQRSDVYKGHIYGVRKGDIEYIKTQKNWVELDKHIIDKLAKMDKEYVMGLVKQSIDIQKFIDYNSDLINVNSPFAKLVNTFKDVKAIDNKVQIATSWLCNRYDVKTNTSPQQLVDKYTSEVKDVTNRYPLLNHISSYSVSKNAIAEYINLIDQSKGV